MNAPLDSYQNTTITTSSNQQPTGTAITIDDSNISKSSGSTILNIHADYLNTLSAGEYLLKFRFTDNKELTSVLTIASSSNTTVSEHDKLFLVTFLDSKGNTVKVEWVKYGENATAPVGYGTYTGYTNVTANMDLKPTGVTSVSSGYIIPNTADKH